MPGRIRTSSEAKYEGSCLEGFPNSRVSAKFAIGQTNIDDDEPLNLGRRPEKRQRQRACGLDRRLSGMLMRADASLTTDLRTTKRFRNTSGSSSSIISSEAPPMTPADAIHERTRGNRLGDDFSIIKREDSADHGLIGFSDNLPSWNDKRKEIQGSENTQKKELPGWLSSTFVQLEPGHPLRTLALTKDQTTINSLKIPQYSSKEAIDHQTKHLEAQDNSIFAYQLPENVDTRAIPVGDFQPEVPVANTHAVEIPTASPDPVDPVFSNASEHLQEVYIPEEPIAYMDPTDRTYLQPSIPANDPPPMELLNPSRRFTPSRSVLSRGSSFNPFATPGPAANFTIFASRNKDGLSRMLFADEGDGLYSTDPPDPLTLIDDSAVVQDPFTVSGNLTSAANIQDPLESKPYSTPGPIFVAPPIVYFDSPTENPAESDPAEPAYDDIQAEIDELDANNTLPTFVANFHSPITADAYPHLSLSQSSPLGFNSNDDDNLMPKQACDDLPLTQLPSSFLLRTPPRRDDAPYVHAVSPKKGQGPTNVLPSSSPLNPPLLSSPYAHGSGPRQLEAKLIDETAVVNEKNEALDGFEEALDEEKDGVIAKSARKEMPAFAPAPGIYLSPLKGEPSSSEVQDGGEADNDSNSEKHEVANVHEVAKPNAKGLSDESLWNLSQVSQDSIESWAD